MSAEVGVRPAAVAGARVVDLDDCVDLSVYAPRVATAWARDHPERRWATPEGTVVFADVTGFTPMTEKLSKRGKVGAEELTDILNDVFGRLLRVAADQGGDLLKFGGDALLLLFTGEQHAERACAAAHAMQVELRAFRRFRSEAGMLSLTMSVGVATGACHLYLVGSSHRELIVTGPVFSRAVELENDAGAGEVLLAPEVAALVPASSRGPELGRGILLERPPTPTVVPVQEQRHDDRFDPAVLVPTALREHLRARRAEGEHRVAVLTFLQFTGTDELLEQSGPDAVAAALDELVSAVEESCETHGLTFLATDIDRDGGKVLLCAGAPRATPRDEDATLHALREVLSRQHTLPVRAGVNVGRAFAVDVGSPSRRTFAVMGDATNLAARVMGRAQPGQIVATAAVTDRTHAAFALQPLEPFRVKGKSEPIHGSIVGRSLLSASVEREDDVPLTGRDAEVGLLLERLRDARAGSGSVVELVGEPGIGKSRLLSRVCADARDVPLVHLEASQYLATTPYLALRAPMQALLGLGEDADDAQVRRVLTKVVAQGAPHMEPLLPLLALAFGMELPDTEVTAAIGSAFRRDRLNDAVDELLSLVLPGPMLVLVDDAQWLDDASSGLLRHLLRRLPERPWCVVVARRPEPGGLVLEPADHVRELELGPLLPEAAAALVNAAAGDVPLAPHVREALVERGAGNPLFLAELVEATVVGGDPDSLPDSIEATVAAAIDQVPASDRSHLRLAAVLGRRFALDVLQRMLAEVGEGEVGTDADRVVARLGRFLTVEGSEVRFTQGLVRDVAYEGLSFRRRRVLHGRAGDLLLELSDEDTRDTIADLLSVHYSVAGRHDACWEWARRAAGRARRAAAPVEAAVHLRRAVEAARHMPSPPHEVGHTWEDLGDVCSLLGRHGEAKAAYATARELCRDQVLDVAELHIKEGRLRNASGAFSAALRWYARGLRLLEDLPPSRDKQRLEAQLLSSYAGSRLDQGRYAESIPLLERAVALASVLADRQSMAYAYYLLDWAHSELGDAEAETYSQLATSLYEGLEDWQGQYKVLNNRGATAYYAGRWREAVDLYEQGYQALLKSGDMVKTAVASHNIAEVLSDQGHLEEAERRFREALSTFRAGTFAVGIAQARSNLARVLVRAGRPDEAAPLYAESRAQFAEVGAEPYVLETDAREAERLLCAGRPAAAYALVEETVARLSSGSQQAASSGAHGVLGAMLDRLAGCALAVSGDVHEARARLEQSVRTAREAEAEFELALTLDALSVVGPLAGMDERDCLAARHEAAEVLRRLGVVAVPRPPTRPGGTVELVVPEELAAPADD